MHLSRLMTCSWGLPARLLLFMAAGFSVAVGTRSRVAIGADNLWVGGASNGNFTDNANWSSPPSFGFGNSLKFNANTNAPTITANYGTWVDNNDIFWDATFPVARTLQSTGNGLGFTLRLENQSSFAQTITAPLSGGLNGAGGIELNPVKGSLILSGQLYNDNSVDYAVYGSNSATLTNLTLNTALGPNATQANVDFTVAGGRNTAVQVNASQLWAGTTNVQSGSFTTGTGVTLASSAIVVAGGTVTTTSANTFADTATVTVTSGRLEIGGSDTVASLAGTGGTVDVAAGATLTLGGSGSTSYFGSLTGAGNLTKVGSGTFGLSSGTSSLTGAVEVQDGRLVLQTRMAAGTVNVNGGSLAIALANVLSDTAAVTISSGTLSFTSVETIGSLAGNGGTVVLAPFSSVFRVQQDVNTTYAGDMTYGQFIKSGTGRLILSGSVAYAEVAAGTIVVNGHGGAIGTAVAAATLAGTGTISQGVVSGLHAPGPAGGGPGIQTFSSGSSGSSSLRYGSSGASMNWELIANTTAGAGTNYDLIAVPTGNLVFDSGGTTLSLSFDGAGSSVDWSNTFWDVNRAWRVWDLGTGATTGFGNLSLGGSLLDSLGNTLSPTARGSFSLSQDGQDVMVNFVAVPEPATVGIALSGLGLAAGFRRKARRGAGLR